MVTLFVRMIIAALTINSIIFYFLNDQLSYFNCCIALWCFVEWVYVFRDCKTHDILEIILPPLNQLCLMIRVLIQEFPKM